MNNRIAALCLIALAIITFLIFYFMGEFDMTAPAMLLLLGVTILVSEVYKTIQAKK